jgi:hypothetical protein
MQLSDQSRKEIEKFLGKPGPRPSISGSQLQCEDGCYNAFEAAMKNCEGLTGEKFFACKMTALVNLQDCLDKCIGAPPP